MHHNQNTTVQNGFVRETLEPRAQSRGNSFDSARLLLPQKGIFPIFEHHVQAAGAHVEKWNILAVDCSVILEKFKRTPGGYSNDSGYVHFLPTVANNYLGSVATAVFMNHNSPLPTVANQGMARVVVCHHHMQRSRDDLLHPSSHGRCALETILFWFLSRSTSRHEILGPSRSLCSFYFGLAPVTTRWNPSGFYSIFWWCSRYENNVDWGRVDRCVLSTSGWLQLQPVGIRRVFYSTVFGGAVIHRCVGLTV